MQMRTIGPVYGISRVSHAAALILAMLPGVVCAQALVGNRLLAPAFTEWILTGTEPAANRQPSPSPLARGGLGIAGSAPGINALLELDLESKTTVIVLGNYDPQAATAIVSHILRLLRAIR